MAQFLFKNVGAAQDTDDDINDSREAEKKHHIKKIGVAGFMEMSNEDSSEE